jgi:hypothetical protein
MWAWCRGVVFDALLATSFAVGLMAYRMARPFGFASEDQFWSAVRGLVVWWFVWLAWALAVVVDVDRED